MYYVYAKLLLLYFFLLKSNYVHTLITLLLLLPHDIVYFILYLSVTCHSTIVLRLQLPRNFKISDEKFWPIRYGMIWKKSYYFAVTDL
jgi:hypothetical protein